MTSSDYLKPRKIVLYALLHDIIKNSVVDINSTRANNSDAKERQWWFPEAPIKIDENFPRGVIDLGASRFIPVGSDNYVDTNYQEEFVSSDMYGMMENIPVVLTVFIKKQNLCYVTYEDSDVQVPIKNKKQTDYFGEILPKLMLQQEKILNTHGFTIDGEISSSPSYENNDFLWAVDIAFTVQTQTLWKESYSDGDLIQSYTISETVEQE